MHSSGLWDSVPRH